MKNKIREMFDYDGGALYWRKSRGCVAAGSKAGTVLNSGYIGITIDGKCYLAHRLVYKWHFGVVGEEIDHINGDKQDNRIENLRVVSRSQNQWNSVLRSDNTSGIKGVTRRGSNWIAQIKLYGRNLYLGRYKDKMEAARRVAQMRSVLHGEYGCNGTREAKGGLCDV